MKFNCGIIGLPNVGKSALFQILTNISVRVDNFPFSTIQPNLALVPISDLRLEKINYITKSKKIIPDTIEFMDIAGLIKGASQGEGLGNNILNHINKTNILCHVVRCFSNNLIIHVENNIDPTRDVNIINTELIFFDILKCEKLIDFFKKNRSSSFSINDQTLYILKQYLNGLYNGIPIRKINLNKTNIEIVKKLNFLTAKPIIYIANVNEIFEKNKHFEKLKKIAYLENIPIIPCCVVLNHDSLKKEKNYNNKISSTIINQILSLLGLNTFFTFNENFLRSWIYSLNTTALEAANKVHSDFKKDFIRVQVIKYNDFITCKGEHGAKKSGKIYFLGKDYLIKDGDILKFLFQKRSQKIQNHLF